MFNNIVLDVAIGLIFIYLLYSLLATTIKEFIATLFSYRARMLERGLEQMLDGRNYSYYWWDRLINHINKRNKNNSKSKYHLKKNLFTNSVSCHPLYKRSGENSKIFNNEKPAYLSADVFSDIIIDVLKSNKDAPTLLKDIAASVKARAADKNDPLNTDLEKILTLYLQQANGDVQRFKLLIENWYNDTMDRVGGWYKRQANRILIVIGLCLAIAFNVSTIDIVKKLSEDKDARNALVQNAEDYLKANANKLGYTELYTNNNDAADSTKAINPSDSEKQANNSDTIKSNSLVRVNQLNKYDTQNQKGTADAMADARLMLKRIDSLYKENIVEENTTLGLGWDNYGGKDDSLSKSLYVLKSALWPFCPQFKLLRLLGFLITAFAVSLGAPFWFDLLNKFINLRVSGAKPNEGTTLVSKTASLNQRPDPTAKG